MYAGVAITRLTNLGHMTGEKEAYHAWDMFEQLRWLTQKHAMVECPNSLLRDKSKQRAIKKRRKEK